MTQANEGMTLSLSQLVLIAVLSLADRLFIIMTIWPSLPYFERSVVKPTHDI